MADDDTGRVRATVNAGIKQVRDRRRKTRQRLEDIFSRETFTSVAVMGAMGKLIEVTVVPFLDPTGAVSLGRAFAWVLVFAAAVAASVYWERLAEAAENVADAAEEKTETDGEGG